MKELLEEMKDLLEETLAEKPKTVTGFAKKAVCVTGIIVGIVVGVIVFLAIVLGIIFQAFL